MANRLDGQISRRDFLIMAAGLTATTTLLNSCGSLTKWISGNYATEEGRQIWGTETPTPPATATYTATNTSTATMEPTATPTETSVPTGKEIAEVMIRIQPKDLAEFRERAEAGELVEFSHPTGPTFIDEVKAASEGLKEIGYGPNLVMGYTALEYNSMTVNMTDYRPESPQGKVNGSLAIGFYRSIVNGQPKSVSVFDARVPIGVEDNTFRLRHVLLAPEDGLDPVDVFKVAKDKSPIINGYNGWSQPQPWMSEEHKSIVEGGVALGNQLTNWFEGGETVILATGPANINLG